MIHHDGIRKPPSARDYLGCWTFVLLVLSLSFNIFIYCYIGQCLQDTCQLLKDKAYIIDWYKVYEKKILALVLFIAMAETPQKLSAGGVMNMCLKSYGETIKSSFVYFNYLRTMT